MDQGKTLVQVCQALSNNELNAFATIWKANAFHHMHSQCCDINNFYIDLVNTPRSPWNQSASRVFTLHFIDKFQLSRSEDMINIVREAFYGRIKSMQSTLRKQKAGKEAVALSLQATRRWLRKQTVSIFGFQISSLTNFYIDFQQPSPCHRSPTPTTLSRDGSRAGGCRNVHR